MPFVKINIPQATSGATRTALSQAIHQSLMAHFDVPLDDYFQVIHERSEQDLRFPQSYMQIPHTANLAYIEITASFGRSVEKKKGLFGAIADSIAATTNISVNDVIIILTEVAKENWSFGQGVAQLAP